MTGAKQFAADATSLQFTVAGGLKIVVSANPVDLYTIETFRIRSGEVKRGPSADHIEAADLQATFERLTGLYVSLGIGRAA